MRFAPKRFVLCSLLVGIGLDVMVMGCSRTPTSSTVQRHQVTSVSGDPVDRSDYISDPKTKIEFVRGAYSSGSKPKIEVAAITNINGDTLWCKSPDGSANTSMESLVLRSLETARLRREPENRPVQGKKNRIVIFRVSTDEAKVDLLEVGDRNSSSPFRIDSFMPLSSGVCFDNRQDYWTYRARSVAVDEGEDKTSALLSISRSTGSTTLQLKVGATCQLNGQTAKVKSISVCSNSNPKYARSFGNRKAWQVQIETPQANFKGFLAFWPRQIAGGSESYVDQNGRRVPEAQVKRAYKTAKIAHRLHPSDTLPFFSEVFIDPDWNQARSIKSVTPLKTCYINVDPRDLKVLSVMSKSTKLVEFKDIPLFEELESPH